ncbi:MAG: aminoglycoside phosphotransferase family protein [Bryobacteraceae bacterium]
MDPRADRAAWLAKLPEALDALRRRWALEIGPPFESGSCAWVAPVRWKGTGAVLKIGMPHMEAEHELQGLLFWNGDPAVHVFDYDPEWNAMLLEACEPGTPLRSLPEEDQDRVIAELARRCWRRPAGPHPFRPLSAQLDWWAEETRAQSASWLDAGVAREGLRLFEALSQPSPDDVLLATDLHAGNVLRAERRSWLMIDPKPFVGDPAYDATQHLRNCGERLRADPLGLIRRVADLFGIDEARTRLWLFARLAAEPREVWGEEAVALARRLAV